MRLFVLLLALLVPTVASATAGDPLELLWSHRLDFAADGSPLVAVRIDEGEREIVLTPRGPGRIQPRVKGVVAAAARGAIELQAGSTYRFRVRDTKPAKLRWSPQVAEFPFRDKEAARAALVEWTKRGFQPDAKVQGGVYGMSGRVLDNRRYVILLAAPTTKERAEKLAADAARRFDVTPTLFAELAERPRGIVDIFDAAGRKLGSSEGVAVVEAVSGITVRDVEHDIGYAAHGREDRTYRGEVFVTVDAEGKAAAVSVLPMEELLRGIVPSEIYATAPIEALKAQAVTARGEVLAKIGARHLGDPYLICAEQHCQVYKGLSGEHRHTDEAIAGSRGEVLFSKAGDLVDSVYSSTCGGHTENNEHVWGTPPDPSLRGVPDWLGHSDSKFADGVKDVAGFLKAEVVGMCRAASMARPEKYRWERTFSATELDALVKPLGVGSVVSMQVTGRGVSGRATGLAITGEKGAVVVQGELKIRRLLGNLNSSLFVLDRQGPAEGKATAWVFRGAGWGHGVGMCQTGAIGRAERGHDHHAILGHYYGGAAVHRLY